MYTFDETGKRRQLGEKLGSGGEGAVYPLAERSDVLVKLYHPDVLSRRRRLLEPKLKAMIAVRAAMPENLGWPRLSVFDEQGRWAGYAMRRAEGASMFVMAHAKLYQRHFPRLDRSRIVAYLVDYLTSLRRLHQAGIFVGDYNLRNMLCDPASSRVTLIDCDSYQFEKDGHFHPCPVLSPDMTPPEHHGQKAETLRRNTASERFSVAIVLFKALMLGRHPYDMVGGSDPVANIQTGHFPYGVGGSGIPAGPWYNIWSHMPYRVKEMFIRCFGEGARNPSARPGLEQWLEELEVYRRELDKGWHETAIRPAAPKSKGYGGSRSL